MDPNELLKHAPELLKGGAAIAGALKFTDIIKAMLGPATGEIAERFRDTVRLYRYGRQLDLKKAEKMAEDAEFTPKAVPIKLLFPLLEGASLEENDDLHTMWAALLANAASPTNAEKVRPGFIATLKQMAPQEAKLLVWISAHDDGGFPPGAGVDMRLAQSELGFTTKEEARQSARIDHNAMACLDALEAQQLVRRSYWLPESSRVLDEPRKVGYKAVDFTITLTHRGAAFISACQPPKPKS